MNTLIRCPSQPISIKYVPGYPGMTLITGISGRAVGHQEIGLLVMAFPLPPNRIATTCTPKKRLERGER